jgi:hypothetical protein
MRIIDCVQGTPEWFAAKLGVPSASNFDRILTAKTLKLSASADDLICELLGDLYRLTPPDPAEFYCSKDMQDGIDREPEARAWYELETGQDVTRVGFCVTDDGRFGCSPDSLVGDDGGLELKCPKLKTQAKYLLAGGGLPDEYRAQVHGALVVTEREWWDFLSYAPGLPPVYVRVRPDEYTEALRKALDVFHERFQEAKRKIEACGLVTVAA